MEFLSKNGLDYFWKQILGKLNGYVVKEDGKVLSTNDYTTTEKDKLSGIATGAEVNQNAFSSINTISGSVNATVSAASKSDGFTLEAGDNITLVTNEATGVIKIVGADAPEAPEASLEALGISATPTELNRVAGVTSNIQTQLDNKVPITRTVNEKALSSNISLTYSDVGAAPAGCGYGDGVPYIGAEVGQSYTDKIDTLIASWPNMTAKQYATYDANFSTYAMLATIYKYSEKAALIITTSFKGATVIRRKESNVWSDWIEIDPSTFAPAAHTHNYVPTSRTINGKALSSNITLSASDVSARSNTWVPALADCTGTLTIAKGGTGATDAANARTNLDITPANIGAAPSEHTHKYLDAYSGTGTVGFGISDSGFWARAQRNGINAEYLYMTKDGQKVYTYNSEGTYVQTLHGTTNVLYSSTQPTGQFKGQLWLKPV